MGWASRQKRQHGRDSEMRRKEQLFPDDHRTILSWEVSDSGGEFHLSVASLVE